MKRVPRITAAIITLNEERMLPDLLTSLKWADEIVLVDGGSRDRTVELASAAGCHVIEHPFDTYAAQRNRALEHATGEWVLSIDADERPTPQLVDEIRTTLIEPKHEAYRIPIRSRIFGRQMRYCGTQDDRPIRLFRQHLRWTGDVHEIIELPRRPGRLRGWLEHETLPDLPAFLRKMQRYTSLETSQRLRRGRAPRGRDLWLSPAVEVARRLVWKKGCLDGPEGWAFCLLSGVSQWVLACKHKRAWKETHA